MAKRENYNELYLFMQVVREGSFTAAAQRLGLAQSGISRSVRDLEARLGVQLLVRTTRRLSLTQAGEQLIRPPSPGLMRWIPGSPLWRIIVRRPPARCASMPASTLSRSVSCQSWRYSNSVTRISAWS